MQLGCSPRCAQYICKVCQYVCVARILRVYQEYLDMCNRIASTNVRRTKLADRVPGIHDTGPNTHVYNKNTAGIYE